MRRKLANSYHILHTPIYCETKSIKIHSKNIEKAASSLVRCCNFFSKHVLRVRSLYAYRSKLPTKSVEGSIWSPAEKVLAYLSQPLSTNKWFFTSACHELREMLPMDKIFEILPSITDGCVDNLPTSDETVLVILFLMIYYSTLYCHCLYSVQPKLDIDFKSQKIIILCADLLMNHASLLKSSSLDAAHLSVLICSMRKYNRNLWISDDPVFTCIKLDNYLQENIRKETCRECLISQTLRDVVLMIVAFRPECIPECWNEISAHNLEHLTELTSHPRNGNRDETPK